MDKAVEITVSLSSNPAVDGDYFLDVRDVTNGARHQLTTRTLHRTEAREFIAFFRAAAERASIAVTVVDTTGEVLGD